MQIVINNFFIEKKMIVVVVAAGGGGSIFQIFFRIGKDYLLGRMIPDTKFLRYLLVYSVLGTLILLILSLLTFIDPQKVAKKNQGL
jgi:hypothetical protein